MKKIICLLSLFLLLNASLVNAEIRKGTDSFTNGISIRSYNEPESSLEPITSFKKILSNESASYEIMLRKSELIELKGMLLADSPLELKIGNNPVLEIKDYKYKITKTHKDYLTFYNTVINAKIDKDVADKIRYADRVALRFECINYHDVYVLPDKVLNEWKQVIEVEGN